MGNVKRDAGTVLGSLLKWVVVPVSLAAIGFYVVGPQVATSYLAKVRSPQSVSGPTTVEGSDTSRSTGAPTVNVKSEKLKPASTRRRKSSRPRSEPDNGENTIRVNGAPEEVSPEPPSDPGNDDGEGPTGGEPGMA